MEDRRMIEEIQRGNREHLNIIAEKYYDDIYRFCCYQTGDRDQSYDLAQETFLRFIRYLDGYHDRNLKGYLLTIAMNVCRDYFRSKGRLDAAMSQEEVPDREACAREGALGRILWRETADAILGALGQLPHMQREVIILHYYYDLKYREIGRLTDTKTATVKSRIRQGTEKLRHLLRKEDFYEEI